MGRRGGVARQAAGFTLIEILIVVTIIIMVFGLAMPTLSKYLSNQKLKSVTGRVARGLTLARTRAITKHQEVSVIFFSDQLMVVSSRFEVPERYDYFSSKREASKMVLQLRFADASVSEETKIGRKKKSPEEDLGPEHPYGLVSDLARIPEEDWSKPTTAASVLRSGLLEGKIAYIKFKSDGTAEFGSGDGPGDRLSIDFWADPPRDADIIVGEQGNSTRGWIDIRATGNVDTRVKVGTPKEAMEE